MKRVLLTFSALAAAASLCAAPVPLSLEPVGFGDTGTILDLNDGLPNMVTGSWDNATGAYSYTVEEGFAILGGGTITILPPTPPGTIVKVDPPETDKITGNLLEVTHAGYVDGSGDPIDLLDGNHFVIIIENVNDSIGDVYVGVLAVPEPHEYALLAGAGLLGLAAYRRLRA